LTQGSQSLTLGLTPTAATQLVEGSRLYRVTPGLDEGKAARRRLSSLRYFNPE